MDGLGLARLQVFVAEQNRGGLRLSERTGFVREGLLRSYGETDGERFDAIVLARLADRREVTRNVRSS